MNTYVAFQQTGEISLEIKECSECAHKCIHVVLEVLREIDGVQ